MLTTATSSDPTPLSIGYAGTSAVSLQGVPSVTGVGHRESKSCTRATLLTIGRSFGGWTTVDSYREGTVTTFHVTTAHVSQHKQ